MQQLKTYLTLEKFNKTKNGGKTMFNKMFGGCGCGCGGHDNDYDKCNAGGGFDCCWIIVLLLILCNCGCNTDPCFLIIILLILCNCGCGGRKDGCC